MDLSTPPAFLCTNELLTFTKFHSNWRVHMLLGLLFEEDKLFRNRVHCSWTTASYRAVVLKAMLLGLVLACQGFTMCDPMCLPNGTCIPTQLSDSWLMVSLHSQTCLVLRCLVGIPSPQILKNSHVCLVD
jgi:hypothetical protein